MPTIISGDGTITGLTATGISAAQTVSASSITTGTLPAARLPAGSILQVVSATYSTETSNSTTTYADTGLSATITPSSASSKILVITTGEMYKSNGSAINSLNLALLRGSTNIYVLGQQLLWTGTALENSGNWAGNYLDSPATTSATTYKIQFKNEIAASTVSVQWTSKPSVITLMEIAG
jgi:hypothetical protein